MKITIHRGSDQIGGCITEYEINGWKLFVDYGEQLPGVEKKNPKIDGLNTGDISKSALLITHYHADHVGNITELSDDLPVFMGRVAKDILSEYSKHMSSVNEKDARMVKRLEKVKTFNAGEVVEFGDFKITPVTIDHSAFDAYAFKIEAKGIKVFHTGDFRTHGFRSGKLFKMLDKFVGKVDYVVCEATNINRTEACIQTESELQKNYEQAFKENKANIVYVATTNIDRLFSLYHAALRAGRPFYVDSYQKRIMDIVTQRDTLWGKSRLYQYGQYEPIALEYEGDDFLYTENFDDFLNKKGYVLIARASDRFDNLIAKMPGDKKIYLSQWSEYINPESKVYKPHLAKSVGENALYLHTSGHTDMSSLFKFFEALNPKAIIPIHTDNPESFAELFSEKWVVLTLNDGEYFNPMKDPGYDNNSMSILAVKAFDDNKVLSCEDNEKCYSLDNKYIGEFISKDDALFAGKSSHYAENRLLGYNFEQVEDMYPFVLETFNPQFVTNAKYVHGNHAPGEKAFQTAAGFQPGEKVMCVIFQGQNIVFPAIYEGPITIEYLKEQFDKDSLEIFFDSFEDYLKEFVDYDWDTVIVRPLVKIDNPDWAERMAINRPYVFPYKRFDI